ncbi:MAG: exodeoxyribonuclease V subunit beta [Acidobacteriota bacterium]
MSRVFDLQSTPIDDGVTLIEASAGTGKTYCLTGLVLRLLLERRISDVGQLLVVTFTHAATQELVERIRGALRDTYRLLSADETTEPPAGKPPDPFFRHLAERYRDDASRELLRDALNAFDDLTVSTIHGFCSRVLDECAFESGMPFEAELLENDAPLLLEAARDVWRRLLYPAPEIVATVAADEGWTPTTFLEDYRLWRRHPNTEMVPKPAHLDTASARLSDTYRDLQAAWSLDAAHQLLARRSFKKHSFFGRNDLSQALLAADAFCRRGRAAGLRAIKELAGARLTATLFKKDQRGVLGHPLIAVVDAFAGAIESYRHALRGRFIRDVDAAFERRKHDVQILSYDDLLGRLRDALLDPNRRQLLTRVVRQRFRVALIDEFQDTDLIQYDIFRRLFRSGPLFLIGDPKQAIYRFRGADVFAYLAAKRDADRCYTLERNWRTIAPLVAAVNAIFERTRRPFVLRNIPFEPAVSARSEDEARSEEEARSEDEARSEEARLVDAEASAASRPPLQWLWLPKTQNREEVRQHIRSAVAAEVVRLLSGDVRLGERSLTPDDLAILVRTNEQAVDLQDALRRAGVPSVVGRSGDIFASEEMAELERLLAAVADPGYAPRLRAAWSTRIWGDDAPALRALEDDDEAFAQRLETFSSYRDDWLKRGFMPMIQRLFTNRRVRRSLLAMTAGERRLTNLLHAVEVLHHEEKERNLSPAALLGWLAAERARESVDAERSELRLETDAPAVQISTVHRSKGLEYEIVFCPFLWQARPVDRPPVQTHTGVEQVLMDCGSEQLDDHLALAEAERLAEDLRLAYVALTRARHRCYVVWGDVGGKDGSAASSLSYLLRPSDKQPAGPQDSQASNAFASTLESSVSDGEWTARILAEARTRRQSWHRQLTQLIARHPEEMVLRPLASGARPSARLEPPARDLQPRRFEGRVERPWTVESFSSLSRGGEAESPDHRDPETPPALQPVGTDDPAEPHSLLHFARGRRAGSCLHLVLEHTDFSALEPDETDQRIADGLRRFGLETAASHPIPETSERRQTFDPHAAVRQMLHDLAAVELPGSDFCLGDVPREHTLVEWKFTTPLANLSPRQLSERFRNHATGRVRDDYAPRLARLSAERVRGYLTGFVDLVFTHRERWYVVDWKSNYLGPTAASYGDAELWDAMCHHHYVLQYHLYVFALHRFLRQRIPDYRYDRHLAGAAYIFLRAVREGSPGAGWYLDRPPAELIEALDELIGGREAA